MAKTLVLYATRMGASADTANVIGEVLKDKYSHEVKVYNIKEKKNINIDDFDNIIFGSSIAAGRWKGSLKKYLKKNNYSGKKTAVFVSAGGTMKAYSDGKVSRQEAVKEAVEAYVDPFITQLGISPVSKTSFGGRFVMFGKEKFNNWNRDDIVEWAEELGNILK